MVKTGSAPDTRSKIFPRFTIIRRLSRGHSLPLILIKLISSLLERTGRSPGLEVFLTPRTPFSLPFLPLAVSPAPTAGNQPPFRLRGTEAAGGSADPFPPAWMRPGLGNRVMQPKERAERHVFSPVPRAPAPPPNRRGRLTLRLGLPAAGTQGPGIRAAAARHALPLRGGGAARRGRRPAGAAGGGVAARAGTLGAARGRTPEASRHRGGRRGAGAARAGPVARGGGAGGREGGAGRGGAGPRGHVLVQVPEAGAGRRALLGRYCQQTSAPGVEQELRPAPPAGA